MITKKDIPFDLLKAIEVIAQANLELIQLKKEDNTYYSFVEKDAKSKNYFKIFIDGTKRIGNFDKTNYAFEWKPIDTTKASHSVSQGNLDQVAAQFLVWTKLVKEINDTPSIHDDNFAKYYSDFYFNEFKIIDDDADTAPFNPDQQDLVELYLTSLSDAITNSTDQIDENVKADLVSEITELKSTLASSTKTKVMKGVTKVFGKLYKTSKNFAKEIITEAKKNLVKKLIELGIEYGPKILEMFTKG